MIDGLTYINGQWFWQVLCIALIVWLVFIWKEQAKVGKRSFYINCLVSFIAIASLTLVVLKPVISTSSKRFKTVILTNGYNNAQLDSLKKAHKKLIVYNYKENEKLFSNSSTPENVFVLGNGLKPYDLWQLDSIKTVYLSGNLPKGISKLKYTTQNTVGNDIKFNGQYLQATKGYRLILEDPSGKTLDSITLISETSQNFQLSTHLKVAGDFIYQLVEKDSLGNSIEKNPLPIIIKQPRLLNVLIINDAPSFETKYLKNYLTEAGHKVLIRSKLTKDRFKYEYFNMDSKPSVSFTKEKLEFFDILIIDALTLKSLSNSSRNAIENSIRERGLGLFIQSNSIFYNNSNRWYSFGFNSDIANTTTIESLPNIKLSKYPFIFKNEFSLQPIYETSSNILSAYKRFGIGRLGATVLYNTYELQLNGNSKEYKQFWAKTIESISKKEPPIVEWNSNSFIGYQDQPYNFQLRTTEKEPVVTNNGGYSIPLQGGIDIFTLWEGVTYPRHIGWQALTLEQDTTQVFKYYVTDTVYWQSLAVNTTINTNKRYVNAQNVIESKVNNIKSPINLLWFFSIFIICMGYLWLVPKL